MLVTRAIHVWEKLCPLLTVLDARWTHKEVTTPLLSPPASLKMGKVNNLVIRAGFGRGAGRRKRWLVLQEIPICISHTLVGAPIL